MEYFFILIATVLFIIIALNYQKQKAQKEQRQKDLQIVEHNKSVYYKHLGDLSLLEEIESQLVDIAGIHIENRRLHSALCSQGEELMLIPDPENIFDENAIEIKSMRGHMLGFIPAYLAIDIAAEMKDKVVFRAFFDRIEDVGDSTYGYIKLIKYK